MSEVKIADSVESQFARRLAGNEKKIRDRALKKLKRYVCLRAQRSDGGFTREEMLRVWKGLFYCMWMSDKPLIQEELSRTISHLMLDSDNTKTSMLFFDVFLQTMLREWVGIDRLRMDKFYLLVRNMLEVSFKFLKSKLWDLGIVDWFLSILKNGPISPVAPYSGMHYHFCDIYLEELAKVAAGEISSDLVLRFLDPYCTFITKARNNDLVSLATTEIFELLIENSKPALDLLAEEEDDRLVDITSHTQLSACDASPVASLTVDYSALADRIFELAMAEDVLAKSKKKAFTLVGKFRELAEGRLALDDIPDVEYSSEDELAKMESSLVTKILKRNSDEILKNHQDKKTRRTGGVIDSQATTPNAGSDAKDLSELPATKSKGKKRKMIESPVEPEVILKKYALKSSALKKMKRKRSIEAKLKSLESPIEDSSIQRKPCDSTIEKSKIDSSSSSGDKELVTGNMPDLVQDVAKCAPKYESLRKWLRTEQVDEAGEGRVTNTAEPYDASCMSTADSGSRNNVLPVSNDRKGTKKKSVIVQKKLINLSAAPKTVGSDSQDIDSSSMHQSQKKSFNKAIVKGKARQATRCDYDEEAAPISSAFVNVAVNKLNKSKEKTRISALKRKPEPVKFHSPKRVAFEMSKIQIKPFRKTDRAMACSPSPAVIAFDPRKKPVFGLLKSGSKRLQRATAADFFGDA